MNEEVERKCKKSSNSKLHRILVNPRLEGLPYAQQFSHLVFICVIVINVMLARYLSASQVKEVEFVVNSLQVAKLDTDNIIDCLGLDSQTSFQYRLKSDLFGAGTSVFIETRVKDLFSFQLENVRLPKQNMEIIRSSCLTEFNTSSKLASFCLNPDRIEQSQMNFRGYSPINSRVGESEDRGFNSRLQFQDHNYFYDVFTTVLGDSVVLTISVTEYEKTDFEEITREIFDEANSYFNLLIFPILSHVKEPEKEINRLIIEMIEAIGGQDIENNILRIALSNSFVTCVRKDTISVFAYFGVLFDFYFFVEGFFSVFSVIIFLLILKLYNYLVDSTCRKEKKEEDDFANHNLWTSF